MHKRFTRDLWGLLIGATLLSLPGCDIGKLILTTEPWEPPAQPAQPGAIAPREPCHHYVEDRQPLFGDLHLHTSLSMDANSLGTRTLPDDAYGFATGAPISIYGGSPGAPSETIQIDRPLDFAAVTDHAEWMAEVALCTDPDSPSYTSTGCAIYRGEQESLLAKLLGAKGFRARIGGLIEIGGRRDDVCGDDDLVCRQALKGVWQSVQASAERWYDRSADCRFTTFPAWEYSRSPQSTKIHRNIILRNEIVPELPISALETPVEMDLRKQLLAQCNDSASGCEAIAIPHNPNLSNGQLFRAEYAGLPLERQRQEAALRARLEPVVEMMQIKGESECRNGMYGVMGGEDELCDFEKIRDFGQPELEDCQEKQGKGAQAGKGCTSRNDYVRYALIDGLREKQRIGANPYQFGFIGSTDAHTSAPGAVSEYEQPYKYGTTITQALTVNERPRAVAFQNPGGLAGVWAEENTRDAIFDALKRRETFATSGPRIAPRFFGGWALPKNLCDSPEFVKEAYRAGVPMGGVMPADHGETGAPRFAVAASADPGTAEAPGHLLQRLQIIKGWVGDGGTFHQSVIDVAGNADNGASVDPLSCAATGEGFATLCGVWEDPDFDPAQDAVYYARAIENPSCRWSTRLCLSLPEGDRPDGCDNERIPKVIQERAWTAPIWYEASTLIQ